MLANFEQLLHNIRAQGLKQIEPRLDNEHMPTVGDMYEGLTRELISKSLFESFDLHVRSGQIQNSDGKYSPQIDCMLVIGDGDKLPYSDSYIYRPNKVVAVFEVKKTLNQSEIEDALNKFAKLTDLALDEFGQVRHGLNLGAAVKIHMDAFRSVCRMAFPHDGTPNSLSATECDVFELLLVEACLPLRIILSFGGYTTEDGFRRGYASAIKKKNNLLAAPSLVICDDLSIVKASGVPFAPGRTLQTGWDIYYSQTRLAIRNLINMLWYRITKLYAKDFLWLTDGKIYTHNILMSYHRSGSHEVRIEDYSSVSRHELGKVEEFSPEPHLVSVEEYVLLRELLQRESISISNESDFLRMLDNGIKDATLAAAAIGCPVRSPVWNTIADLLKHLEHTRLIARQGESLFPTISRCVLFMTGEGMFAGENRDGRFTRRFIGPGLFLPDAQRPASVVIIGMGSNIGSYSSERESWLELAPEKNSQLVTELHGWIGRIISNGLREPARVPSIKLVTVRHDQYRISTIRSKEYQYEIRLSDAVEMLLRDAIFRWLALPDTCTEIGDPNLEIAGPLLGQFNKSLFQLEQDAFPYQMRIPKCKDRERYAQELLAVAMHFLVAHSMAHVLLGHLDYSHAINSADFFDEQEIALSTEEAKNRQAMEWSADVVGVNYLCGNRFSLYDKHGSMKTGFNFGGLTADPNVTPPTFDKSVLLVERAIAIATMYSERAWFHIQDEDLLSHPYPQWRFVASLNSLHLFLQRHFAKERDSVNIPSQRALEDIVLARRGIIWAKIDSNVIARFADVTQASICKHWQAKMRPLLEPHAYVTLPTCS